MKNLALLVILILVLVTASFIQKKGPPAPIQSGPTPSSINIQTSTLVPPTLIPARSSQKNIQSFVYPGSAILSQSDKEIILQSSDGSSSITNWYKEKIASLNINAKSFVQTNTNGNIFNKLVGASAGFKVKIQIEKNRSSNITTIKVSLE